MFLKGFIGSLSETMGMNVAWMWCPRLLNGLFGFTHHEMALKYVNEFCTNPAARLCWLGFKTQVCESVGTKSFSTNSCM